MRKPKKLTKKWGMFLLSATIMVGLYIPLRGLSGGTVQADAGRDGERSVCNPEPYGFDERAVERGACVRPSFGDVLPFITKGAPLMGSPRVIVGDFNGDGFPDVAMTRWSDFNKDVEIKKCQSRLINLIAGFRRPSRQVLEYRL
jgi:hypothetical protein